MTDILIRDVPAEDVERLDRRARQYGLSRADFLRQCLHAEAQRSHAPVTAAHLAEMADLLGDLDDPEVMEQAWS